MLKHVVQVLGKNKLLPHTSVDLCIREKLLSDTNVCGRLCCHF